MAVSYQPRLPSPCLAFPLLASPPHHLTCSATQELPSREDEAAEGMGGDRRGYYLCIVGVLERFTWQASGSTGDSGGA
ncbi:hypothetical protein E2C01_010962 [Portunus trituberculatus]|uniref:Uncharacterized protein n=1 Tax=Portunus trituberculatus TaxID=210409 RepID=A0A5B7DA58_PORTR|nr:hypothetical protein [Portunus trituberculatus]